MAKIGQTPLTNTQTFQYDYHSGANIGIFVGGFQLTDAVGFEVSLTQTKQPVYGYASSLYDGVASGIVQVSGTLWLNFKQSQLMSSIIAQHTGGVDPNSFLGQSLSVLADNGILISDFTTIEEQSDVLKETIWGKEDGNVGANVSLDTDKNLMPYARPDQHLEGFDISVTYGVPFNFSAGSFSTIRKVKDVRIIGFGQSIHVDGEPIIETYPFIAREVI